MSADVYYWLRGTSAQTPLVCFHFFVDMTGQHHVEIQIGNERRVVYLWELCRDMFPISQEAAERSK